MTAPWGEVITASNLCTDAALELGAIGEGEALSDSQPADVLRRLNGLIDSSQLDRSKIFRYAQDSGVLVAGQKQYSVGPAGSGADFQVAGGRPLRVWLAFVRDLNGLDIPVSVAPDRTMYDAIVIKSGVSTNYPQVLFYDNTNPLGQLYLWPVPSAAFTLFWNADGQLAQYPALSTAFAMPPGYYRWLVTHLAIECADYFQLAPSANLLKRAAAAAKNLANYNHVDATVRNDFARKGPRGGYNTYIDGYGGRT